MLDMSVTSDVSKPVRLRDSSDEQPENMQNMLVTFEVSNPVKSTAVRDVRSENIPFKLEGATTSPSKDTDFRSDELLFHENESESSPRCPERGLMTRSPSLPIRHMHVPD